MGTLIKEHFILISKTEGKSPLGMPKLRWKGKNLVGLKEVDCVDWIHSDAVAKSCERGK